MKKTLFLLVIQVIVSGLFLKAQDVPVHWTGVDIGTDIIACAAPHMSYIREDRTLYGANNSASSLQAAVIGVHIGLKREKRFNDNRVGFVYGLSFFNSQSTLAKSAYNAENTNYFFMLFRQDGLTTEYLRIKSLEEKIASIGIPVEIRYFFRVDGNLKFYLKAGADVSLQVHHKLTTHFYDEKMSLYADKIEAITGSTQAFQSRCYGATGVSLARPLKPELELEFTLPYLFLTSGNYSLADPVFGTGIQLRILFPI